MEQINFEELAKVAKEQETNYEKIQDVKNILRKLLDEGSISMEQYLNMINQL